MVAFPVPADRAFAYLADPRNRPRWQSSLRAVADVAVAAGGPTAEGVTWTDVTVVPGVRPRMRTTRSTPSSRWVEEGVFGPFRATLALTFGLYGLLRKTAPLGSLEGFAVETLLLFLPALGYLFYLEGEGRLVFGHAAPATTGAGTTPRAASSDGAAVDADRGVGLVHRVVAGAGDDDQGGPAALAHGVVVIDDEQAGHG